MAAYRKRQGKACKHHQPNARFSSHTGSARILPPGLKSALARCSVYCHGEARRGKSKERRGEGKARARKGEARRMCLVASMRQACSENRPSRFGVGASNEAFAFRLHVHAELTRWNRRTHGLWKYIEALRPSEFMPTSKRSSRSTHDSTSMYFRYPSDGLS